MIKIIKAISECTNRLLVTHPGPFHADDVFATVILYLVFDGNVSLLRTNELPRHIPIPHIVYDVGHDAGYTRYDHHQPGGNGSRWNNIPYAASGLVWRDFGGILLEKKGIKEEDIRPIWKRMDREIIQVIDAYDNGYELTDKSIFGINRVIADFNPTWLELDSKTNDEAFVAAFMYAKHILERHIEICKAKILARPLVWEAIENSSDGILILEQYLPWEGAILSSTDPKAQDILFVITPSTRQGFTIQGVKKEHGNFEVKKPYPKKWAGLTGKALQKASGIETATFCHPSGFMASTLTLEDAKKMAALAVNYTEESA